MEGVEDVKDANEVENVDEKENIEIEGEINDAENTENVEDVEDAGFVQDADDANSVDDAENDDYVDRDEVEIREDTDSEDENDVEDRVNDELVRCIESRLDDGYWSIFPCRIRMPGNRRDGIITMDRNVTVTELNRRLDATFSYRAYFIGRWVNGEILPNDPGMTMRELDNICTDFAIGVGAEEWSDGLDLEELYKFTKDF